MMTRNNFSCHERHIQSPPCHANHHPIRLHGSLPLCSGLIGIQYLQCGAVRYCTAEFVDPPVSVSTGRGKDLQGSSYGIHRSRSVFKRPVSRVSPHLRLSVPRHSCLIAPRNPCGLSRRHWYSPSCSAAIVAVAIWIRRRRERGKARGIPGEKRIGSEFPNRRYCTSYSFFFVLLPYLKIT